MQPFEDFFIEDILQCGTNDFGAGLQARLYFAPADFFSAINLPAENTFQDLLLISISDIFFKVGKQWNMIQVFIDENELKTTIQGSNRRKKTKSNLEVFVLGFRAKVLGFIELMKNENLIFCIITSDGHGILFGNLQNFANIDKADATTAKKYEDNPGVTIAATTNSPVYIFKENLVIETSGSTPTPGGSSFEDFHFIDLTQDY